MLRLDTVGGRLGGGKVSPAPPACGRVGCRCCAPQYLRSLHQLHRVLLTHPNAAHSRPTNPIVRTFVLPDFTPGSKNKLGYVRTGLTPPPPSPPSPDPSAPPTLPQQQKDAEEEQLLHLCNERFTVPEVLFNPTTIGTPVDSLPRPVEASGLTRRRHPAPEHRLESGGPRRDGRARDCGPPARGARHVLGQHCLHWREHAVPGVRRATVRHLFRSQGLAGETDAASRGRRNDLRTFAPTEFDIRVTLSSACAPPVLLCIHAPGLTDLFALSRAARPSLPPPPPQHTSPRPPLRTFRRPCSPTRS